MQRQQLLRNMNLSGWCSITNYTMKKGLSNTLHPANIESNSLKINQLQEIFLDKKGKASLLSPQVEMEGVEPSSRTGKTCAFYMLIRDSVFEPDKVPGGPAS